MRDLLFKNLISEDRKRKIIASSEIIEKEGVRSIIRRHFICVIRQIEDGQSPEKPLTRISVLKEHNTKEQRGRFFCKLKGSVYAVNREKIFLISFMHTLKIDLITIPQAVS